MFTRRRLKRLIPLLGLLLVIFGGKTAVWFASRGVAEGQSLDRSPGRVGIVFGAGLSPEGGPSPLLEDRLLAAEDLLGRHIVDRLLLSGDNRTATYNEPRAMLRATLSRGYDPDLIAVDYGGRRTWDSCRRAREIFGVTHAVLITNDFHRNRTVAICRAAGIHVDGAVGTPTGRYPRSDRASWQARELGASWRAAIDIWINNPEAAVSGEPIDIFDPEQVRRSLTPEDRVPPPREGS